MAKLAIIVTLGSSKLYTEAEQISTREFTVNSGFLNVGDKVEIEVGMGKPRKAKVTKKKKLWSGHTRLTLRILS